MDKVQKHRVICNELTNTYEAKNHDYGDSFKKVRDAYPWAIFVRLHDKLGRLEVLSKSDAMVDESIEDTLKDMANYCIMELIERGYEPSKMIPVKKVDPKDFKVDDPDGESDGIKHVHISQLREPFGYCHECHISGKLYAHPSGRMLCAKCWNKEEDDLK